MKPYIFGAFALFVLSIKFISCTTPEDEPTPPVIESIEPMIARTGDTITIIGRNFIPGKTFVKFNQVPAGNRIKETTTEIVTTVPGFATTGNISITVNGLFATSSTNFKVFNPTILEISHSKAFPGAKISIRGWNLVLKNDDGTTTDPIVKFNGVEAVVTTKNEDYLEVTVPHSPTIGKITINVGPFQVISSEDFFIVPWVNKADFVNETYGNAGFSIGKKIYIVGGYQVASHVFEYDTETDTWLLKNDFPGGNRNFAAGFSINGKGYIGTGDAFSQKDFWEYDPATDTWTQKADVPGPGRVLAVAFSIGSKGYIGGSAQNAANDFWEFDPGTNSWTQKSDIPGVFRGGSASFVISGKGYVTSGGDNTLLEFNPASNIWTTLADYPGAGRTGTLGFAVNGKGYVGAGAISSELGADDLWEYDPLTNTWTQKAGMYRNSYFGLAIVADGKAFAGFGMYFGNFNNLSADRSWWQFMEE